jgi:hypothetical protein
MRFEDLRPEAGGQMMLAKRFVIEKQCVSRRPLDVKSLSDSIYVSDLRCFAESEKIVTRSIEDFTK